MKQCQYCSSKNVVSISCKCNDAFCVTLPNGEEYTGYVDSEKVGLDIGYGDYVEFSVCRDCKIIQEKERGK